MATPAPPGDTAVAAALGAIMSRISAHQDRVVATVERRIVTEITQLRDDSGLGDLLGASVAGNVDTIFRALRHQIPIHRVEPPTAALEYARRVAQHGIPMNALIRAYRLGHALVLGAIAEELETTDLEPQLRLAVFEQITDISFRYVDWISQQVSVVYEHERDRWLENRNSAREIRVREVLISDDGDTDAVAAAIGYPMRRTNLALMLWRPEAGEVGDDLIGLERFLRALTEALSAQGDSLFVGADQSCGWGWIPLSTRDAPAVAARVRRFVGEHPEAPAVALGSALPGLDGFRRSHRQAHRARGMAIAMGLAAGGVISADDPGFATAAMLGEDLEQTRDWVAEVLGSLATDTANDARLRETLWVFLQHGSSYKAAAAELRLHFNSVKYRVVRAGQRRGRPIADERLDVELALLVCRWFGGAVLQPGG